MSLLEDVFLQDEAHEAEDLERVIEGDEFDERPINDDEDDDNQSGHDEAEEDKRRVDPTQAKPKRVVKNPRVVLNPARLTGPRGIQVIPEHFKDFKFKGKGHEKEDLDLLMKKLEHWAYRLYPKFQFEDCLKKIETLGKKAPVMVQLRKIRSDQLLTDEIIVQKDSSDDEATESAPPQEDEFDKLLQQQIELARSTPAPNSAKKGFRTPGDFGTPFSMPKATSSPSISEEQKERMLRNKQLAEQRRLARLKNNMDNNSPVQITIPEEDVENSKDADNITIDLTKISNVTKPRRKTTSSNEEVDLTEEITSTIKKPHRNIIDSSDDEDSTPQVISIDVDVHSKEPTAEEIIEAERNVVSDENDDLTEIENDNMEHFPIAVKMENVLDGEAEDLKEKHENGSYSIEPDKETKLSEGNTETDEFENELGKCESEDLEDKHQNDGEKVNNYIQTKLSEGNKKAEELGVFDSEAHKVPKVKDHDRNTDEAVTPTEIVKEAVPESETKSNDVDGVMDVDFDDDL